MLFTADEGFFTVTAMEVVPILEVNKRVIGSCKPGPVTKASIAEYKTLVADPANGVPI